MTKDERAGILMAVAFADGGCTGCVGTVLDHLKFSLPAEPFATDFGEVSYDNVVTWQKRWLAAHGAEELVASHGYTIEQAADWAREEGWTVVNESNGVKESNT